MELDLDGRGAAAIDTGMPFLDHMLELLARHALVDLKVKARGDLDVDYHHTVEDLGLVLGSALDQALGDRKGINRYGWCYLPMDDALGRAVVDLGGRPYLVYQMQQKKRRIGSFDTGLLVDLFQAFTVQGRLNLHLCLLYGREPHHNCEALFKALARALRTAVARDPREGGVPSSKGRI